MRHRLSARLTVATSLANTSTSSGIAGTKMLSEVGPSVALAISSHTGTAARALSVPAGAIIAPDAPSRYPGTVPTGPVAGNPSGTSAGKLPSRDATRKPTHHGADRPT